MTVTNKQSLSMLLAGTMTAPFVLADVIVTGLTLDSRQVQRGNLFITLSANKEQRALHIEQALTLGAIAILFDASHVLSEQETVALAQENVKAYPIKNLADKAGEIAARFYGHPSLAMTVIAVTGTNGKTSVSQFIAQSLEFLGFPCGVIGTLGIGRLNNLQSSGMTTPDPVSLQAALAEFCQQTIKYAVIEASSHALEQGRLNSVDVDVAVLTNLSRDHLDYHQDMVSYAAAKQRLFDMSNLKTAVINSDDDFGISLMTRLAANKDLTVISYSSQGKNAMSIQAQAIDATNDGVNFELVGDSSSAQIQSSLLGRFNVDNLLATAASLLAINVSFDDVIRALVQCHSVEGRMQCYGGDQQPHLVIDFAHTPDALEQVLKSLRVHLANDGQLWCVFGCGGDRDMGKRAVMGQIAEQYADRIVLTDDNPRSEMPAAIVNDILSGIKEQQKVHVEHDRKLAITYVITHANDSDMVLVAGKGHEQYQETAGVKHPFSDALVVKQVLLAANDATQSLLRSK
ncbi:MAG: UDP-N-acetylmuramoyl-L-alanyl-D-glutamate--2,6-diaminopimelate ligase [Pseudomonadota bacterium]|nr:UDP-N-acetylmuramoyl-L-alanyl-D-glutamate--2,6-diaminopimelate ligase [Pseudomonadota bacterium]MDO7711696.1 UDP-N-acetylmuramoyl-L-alanyl-D-glutamate--2,6-diaminopimelate ligase [Pseudomonadota bacterium]